MFERFTEGARRALFFARLEASQLGALSIEGEHLLLGLAKDENGPCSAIFAKHGLSDPSIRADIAAGRSRVPESVEIPFSAATKKALQAADVEAQRLHHHYLGTEHLLLGLLAAGESLASKILADHGLALDGVRSEIERLLEKSAASVDGFVATLGEGLSWLEPFRAALDEIGYSSLQQSIDAMILGSLGFGHALGFNRSEKPCWIWSQGSLRPNGANAFDTTDSPAGLVKELRKRNHPVRSFVLQATRTTN